MSQILVDALTKIAAFGDKEACAYLDRTGRYARFDEPDAVERARKALAAHEMFVEYINRDGNNLPQIEAAAAAIYAGPIGDDAMPVPWAGLSHHEKDQFRMAARLAIVTFFRFKPEVPNG